MKYVSYRYSVNSAIFLLSQIGVTDSNSLRGQSNFEVCQFETIIENSRKFRKLCLTECKAEAFMKIIPKVFYVVPIIQILKRIYVSKSCLRK